MEKNKILIKTIVCFVLGMLWICVSPASVSAHKVMIFAWVDGDTVHTQSKFSGGKRAQNALVQVYGPKDDLLLEGKTDEKGMFSFKIPQNTSLKVVLNAAMCHRAEWTIPAEEIGKYQKKISVAEKPAKPLHKTSSVPVSTGIKKDISVPAAVLLTKEDIEKIIDASLDKKLAPITGMLADSMEKGPSITQIMGGIGYIFGLMGIAMYFANRKKNGQ